MKYFVAFILSFIFFIGFSNAQNVAAPSELEELYRLKFEQEQGGGCLNTMVKQVDQSLTSEFQNVQNETNTLMGISQKYYDLAKECRNDLGEALNKLREERLRHQKERNSISAKIKQAQLDYRKAVLQVKRDCDSDSRQQFAAFKETVGSGVVTADRGGPRALFNRTNNINQWQKLFYDDCMANSLNLEQVNIHKQEMEIVLELHETNLRNSSETLSTVQTQLEENQDRTMKDCLAGEQQLEYQEALLRNQIAAAKSLTKKQNIMGMMGAVNTCFFGPGSILGGLSDTTNANRGPTSTGN